MYMWIGTNNTINRLSQFTIWQIDTKHLNNDYTIQIFHLYVLYRHYMKYNERLMDHIHKANAFSMRYSLSMFTKRWDLVFLCFQKGRI